MKKIYKKIKSTSLFLLVFLAFVACNEDFTSLQTDVQGAQNFDRDVKKYAVAAYTKKLNPVPTNNLSSNLLGVYKDDVYGLTKAHVVAQIVPTTFNPDFGEDPQIKSVMLTIPYYVTNKGNDSEGNATYDLDSVFSNNDSYNPIKLSIYQNTYFLRDFNPENPDEVQNYYSNANQTLNFDAFTLGDPLYTSNLDFGFTFSNSPHIITELNEETLEEEEVDRIAPAIYKNLYNQNSGFWEDLLFFDSLGSEPIELSNANNFKEYFRGLYFKTDAHLDNGSMALLNFGAAKIEVNYTNVTGSITNEDGIEEDVRTDQVYEFTFTGNRVNLFENDPTNTIIANSSTAANQTEGDETLYIKGGEGALSVINLFGNSNREDVTVEFEEFLSEFKNEDNSPKRLINEANLVFTLNENIAENEAQRPQRVVIYDLENNTPIIDYLFDLADTSSPENSKIFHSVPLRESNGKKVYKIRLTEHINNILLKDSTNYKLGLYVTTNINETSSSRLLNSGTQSVKTTMPGSILTPRGTVLYGSHPNVADENRVQLEIYYTEPNN